MTGSRRRIGQAKDDLLVSIGQALQAAAERRDLSHRAAAEEIGVAQQTFSKWTAEEFRPGPQHLPAIARFLGLSERKTREVWEASAKLGAGRRATARLDRIEAEIEDIRKALTKLLARLPRDS